MSQGACVIAAYGVTLTGAAIVSIVSWRTMRGAESRAEKLSDRA